jgi:hypothetical protein
MAVMRLSGWLRLWLVATLAIWTAGVVHFFLQYDHRPMPPIVMSRLSVCDGYYVSELDAYIRSLDAVVAGRPTSNSNSTAEACLTDDAMFAEARAWHWRDFFYWWGRMWPYWLAPFALGLLMTGGLWVRQGFSRKS